MGSTTGMHSLNTCFTYIFALQNSQDCFDIWKTFCRFVCHSRLPRHTSSNEEINFDMSHLSWSFRNLAMKLSQLQKRNGDWRSPARLSKKKRPNRLFLCYCRVHFSNLEQVPYLRLLKMGPFKDGMATKRKRRHEVHEASRQMVSSWEEFLSFGSFGGVQWWMEWSRPPISITAGKSNHHLDREHWEIEKLCMQQSLVFALLRW